MISRNKKYSVWAVYLLLAPFFYYIAFNYMRSEDSLFSLEYALFIVLSVLVALFPIKTETNILFLLNGISVATLVVFGLPGEFILSSLAIIALMVKSNIKWDDHFRYPMNLLMFHAISVTSAAAYHLVEINFETSSPYNASILAVISYLFVNLTLNRLIIYLLERFFYKKHDSKYLDSDFYFSIYTSLFIAPLSFILIYLYAELKFIGVLIGALPFITMTIGMNQFYKSRENTNYLKKVNQYSQKLAEKKSRRDVIDTYLESLITIFPADYLSYFSVKENNEIRLERVYQNGKEISKKEDFTLANKSTFKESIDSSEVRVFNRAIDWKQNEGLYVNEYAESVLLLPVQRKNSVVGLIVMSHQTKNMYNELLISLVKLFHQYFSIAFDNALQYEMLEENAETDYLTGLPNLKGFSKKLEKSLTDSKNESVSLVVLDLDHFKHTNDTYGHQAGNEVLKQVADVLTTIVDDKVSVARYGGEEFVILLPNHSKEEARSIAEEIRIVIQDTAFVVRNSIMTNDMVTVSVTASFGVATYPTDCGNANELIILADRAMYIGSKQKGRNRVTIAETGSKKYAKQN